MSSASAAIDRASYERAGTRSHVSFPLCASGPLLGVLSFDSVRGERAWPDESVERLRLLSEAFASALERKRMELSLADRWRLDQFRRRFRSPSAISRLSISTMGSSAAFTRSSPSSASRAAA